ncbi:hypothetical protein OHB26_36480 [Nocardia sp. NBC_01503]|nr:hypothetical protein [Nocardia sp. NBC_01503]WTL32306.1 hypothetical protein OHB26_36480 [Nocardia sp. NBC_01503]
MAAVATASRSAREHLPLGGCAVTAVFFTSTKTVAPVVAEVAATAG